MSFRLHLLDAAVYGKSTLDNNSKLFWCRNFREQIFFSSLCIQNICSSFSFVFTGTTVDDTQDGSVPVSGSPGPPVAPQVTCDSVLVTGWIVSAVLFLILLFFCLGMAIQSKRGTIHIYSLGEGRIVWSGPLSWTNYFKIVQFFTRMSLHGS